MRFPFRPQQGYTQEEKVEIAQRHLIPHQLEQHGLTPEHIQIPQDTMLDVISRSHTHTHARTQASMHVNASRHSHTHRRTHSHTHKKSHTHRHTQTNRETHTSTDPAHFKKASQYWKDR